MKLRFAICLLSALAACTQVPELDDKVTPQVRGTKYPKLVPIEQALGHSIRQSVSPEDQAQEITQQLEARRDSLKRRAEALQKPVVTEADRDRLDETVPRPASD